jgi:hypothetical protein
MSHMNPFGMMKERLEETRLRRTTKFVAGS